MMLKLSDLTADEIAAVMRDAGCESVRTDPDAALAWVIERGMCPRCNGTGGKTMWEPCGVCGRGPDTDEIGRRKAEMRGAVRI